MSSHREAPEISKDPCADSTDLYAFVSPDKSGTVTIIANYIPLQAPDGAVTLNPGGNYVEPYFATKALIVAQDGGLDVREAASAWRRQRAECAWWSTLRSQILAARTSEPYERG